MADDLSSFGEDLSSFGALIGQKEDLSSFGEDLSSFGAPITTKPVAPSGPGARALPGAPGLLDEPSPAQSYDDLGMLGRRGADLERGLTGMEAGGAATRVMYGMEEADVDSAFDLIDQGKVDEAFELAGSTRVNAVLAYRDATPEQRAELRAQRAENTDLPGQIAELMEVNKRYNALPNNPRMAQMAEAGNEHEYGKAFDIFLSDPFGIIASVGTESAPAMLPGMVASVATANPVVGMGMGSAWVEQAGALQQGIDEAVRAAGGDPANPEDVQRILSDPTVRAELGKRADIRAGIIGLVDAASGGLASKTMGIGQGVTKELTNIAVQTPIQGAMGATGEGAAEYAVTGEVKPGNMALEFLGEAVTAPADIAVAALSGAKKSPETSLTPDPKPMGPLQGSRQPAPITPSDVRSPIPTDLIQQGKNIVAQALAQSDANKILSAAGLPQIGARVNLTYPDGRKLSGNVVDAFSATSSETGATDNGIKIKLDDGTVFEEFEGTIRQAGLRIDADPKVTPQTSIPSESEASRGSAVVQQVPGAERPEGAGAEVLPSLLQPAPQGTQPAQPVTGTSGQAEGQGSGQKAPQEGRPGSAAVPDVRQPERGNAPSGLQQVAGSGVAVSALPSQAPPADGRGGERASAAGVASVLAPDEGQAGIRATGDGTRSDPIRVTTAQDLDRVRPTAVEGTTPQQEAQNHKMIHADVHGLPITITNTRGSTRKGTAPDGTEWENVLEHDRGHIKRTKGGDGQNVDVILGPNPQSVRTFIIDQIDPATGKWDEHKAMLGFNTQEEAVAAYDSGFTDRSGPSRRGAVVAGTTVNFKRWLNNADTTKPLAYRGKTAAGLQGSPTAADQGGITLPTEGTNEEGRLQPAGKEKAGQGSQEGGTIQEGGEEQGTGPAVLKPAAISLPNPDDVEVSARPSNRDERHLGKWKGYAATNQGGRNSVDAFGDTAEEAKQKALAKLKDSIKQRAEKNAARPDDLPEHPGLVIKSLETGKTTTPQPAGTRKPKTPQVDALPGMTPLGAKPSKLERKEIGKNADGETIEEDGRGVRSVAKDGVRTTEKVAMKPGGEISVDRTDKMDARFKPVESQAETLADNSEALASNPTTNSSPAAPANDKDANLIALADHIAGSLSNNIIPTALALQKKADEIMGGKLSEGAYDRKDMYDALELGINKYILELKASPSVSLEGAQAFADMVGRIVDRLPTQTVRSEEQVRFQQFSTPPHYAYAVAWVANINHNDVVLEPSAGTGGIAVHAANALPNEVVTNELADRRAAMLRSLKIGRVFQENAEQLNNILPASVKPTVVVMNPPFSQTAGRMGDKKVLETGATHIEQALKRLEPGGRLVAIVGQGMSMDAPRFREWWSRIAKEYTVRANVGVDGRVYGKYGTSFGTRVLVFDKIPPAAENAIIQAEVADIPALLAALKEVRDARESKGDSRSEQDAGKPGGDALAGEGEATDGGRQPARPGAGSVGPGDRGDGSQSRPGSEREPVGEPGPDADVATVGMAGVAANQPKRPGSAGAKAKPDSRPGTGGQRQEGGGRDAGSDSQPDGGARSILPVSSERTDVADAGEQQSSGEITDSVYENYKPQRLVIAGSQPHPGPLVQSAAMASVSPPKPSYSPNIPKKLIESGALSIAQMEAVVYAGQAHEKMLPAAEGEVPQRRGFFIGDGTGVGKGREVAGIILDNWNKGRTKAVWISEKKTLLNDARRDWTGMGQDPDQIFDVGKTRVGTDIKASRGILFGTYDTLKGGLTDQKKMAFGSGFIKGQRVSVNTSTGVVKGTIAAGKPEGTRRNETYRVKLKDGSEQSFPAKDITADEKIDVSTRIQQIADWLGKDFDGVIAFDEAHNMANAVQTKGNRGTKDASAKAMAGVELQKLLPKARIVYVSATGATEVTNLAYAERLGLWGRGTAFVTMGDFVSKIEQGGIAAMELIARDMKAMGLYIARGLSYDGVEYDRVEHTLNESQREIYDTLAEAWQVVLQNIDAALKLTGAMDDDGHVLNSRARTAALSAFWGANQRFFNQVITSMQMPSVLKAVEKDLSEGRQAVLQLVNTNEASQERAAAKAETAEDLEDLDITPRDQIIQLVENSFPTQAYKSYIDDNGNERSRPVVDSEGNPVENREAVALRDALIERLASVKVPQGPLELVLDHFGADTVAEITGRGRRFIMKRDDKTGQMKRMEDVRPGSANISETEAFQDGRKKILIFSGAGGTGRSYHADKTSKSKDARRSHYLVQAGWRADAAIQGFGRTHRTNQESAPIFRLVTTDLKGQKRFISSIARRLSQLGALTKGQRQTGDQGVFSARDNLESREAQDALLQFYRDLRMNVIEGVSLADFQQQTGLVLVDPNDGGLRDTLPPIQQFLNRLLSLKIDLQAQVFNAFEDRLDAIIEAKRQAGTLDVGLETVRADKITKESEQVVHTDKESGAETRYVHVATERKTTPKPFEEVAGSETRPVLFWTRSPKSKIFAAVAAPSRTTEDGEVTSQYRLIEPMGNHTIEQEKIEGPKSAWTKIDPVTAERMWNETIERAPKFAKDDLHMITGAVLPIWDRLAGHPRILRLQTDAGERLLGRAIPGDQIADTLRKLGAEVKAQQFTPEAAIEAIESGKTAVLANGWTIQQRLVAGEQRIEVKGPASYSEGQQIVKDGAFVERIQYQSRYFIPTGETAAKVFAKITEYRPVVEMRGESKAQRGKEHRGVDAGSPELGNLIRLLNERMRTVGIDDAVRLRIMSSLEDNVFGWFHSQSSWGRLIEVSLESGDAYGTLNHEVIHALRDLNLFTSAEWNALEAAARNSPMLKRIKREYADLDEVGQLEEVIAEMFRKYANRAGYGPMTIRGLLERISHLIQAVREVFRETGYKRAQDVFSRVESGEVGTRDRVMEETWLDPDLIGPDPNDIDTLSPKAQRGAKPARPKNAKDKLNIENAETNRRVQDAFKGIDNGEGKAAKMKEWLADKWHGFSRHYRNLPDTAEYADVGQQLRKLEASPGAAKERIVRILREITEGMNEDDLKLFAWKVALDDLSWEVTQDHQLPFGLTPETLTDEKSKVDAVLATRPDLTWAVRQRKLLIRDVANSLVKAGVLHRDQVKNPAYYRHQVLDYARAVTHPSGTGKKLKTPYWAKRHGSTLDINLNLLEAEFDWLHKAMVSVDTVKTIDWIKKSKHNVRGQVVAAAKAHNDAQIKALLDAEGIDGPLHEQWTKFRQRIAMGLAKVKKAIEDGDLYVPEEWEDAAGNLTGDRANDANIFPFLAWIMDNDDAGAAGAAQTFKAIAERRDWVKSMLGPKYADPLNVGELVNQFAPEGYVAWQPDSPDGNGKALRLYVSKSLPEQALQRMMEKALDGVILPAEFSERIKRDVQNELRSALTVGASKYEMVIPQELADTLNNLRNEHEENVIAALIEKPTRLWKLWTLFNPRRVLKYNLNNLSGDLDAVIAGNPHIMKRVPKAARELFNVMAKKGKPTERYMEAIERGVFDSGFTLQEIPDINYLSDFEHLTKPMNWKNPLAVTKEAARRGWAFTRGATTWRENVFRYAAYLDYVERLESGMTPEQIGYGATRPEIVDAVGSKKDQAALMARDLIGDYGAISAFGQQLRRYVIPFWSFQEINLRRYWRLNANAWKQGVVKGAKTSAITGAALGLRTTLWLYIRMFALYGAINIWNYLMFDDEEDDLDPEERARLHLTLGKWNGELVTMRLNGSLSDIMSWFGFSDALAVMYEVERGRADLWDILGTIAKAPVNKIVNSITPVIKTPLESATGTTLYPDVFDARPIRDNWRNLAKSFSLENEYDLLTDSPSRGYLKSWVEGVVSARDPGESAYNRIRFMAVDWERRVKGQEPYGGSGTPRSNAYYKLRTALKYGDKVAEADARKALQALGTKADDLKDMFKHAHPLGGLAKKDRPAFMQSLSSEERRVLGIAERWYDDVFR